MSDSGDDTLGMLRTWFQTAEDASQDGRQQAETARDYYDGKQLTKDEQAALIARGQPVVIANRIKPKINYLRGLEKKGRQDPKAYPRNPADEDAADAATQAIRFVCDDNSFDDVSSDVWDNLLIEGFGGADVVVERDYRDELCIRVLYWPWDRLFYDIHSRRPDFSDAKYLGGVMWMDEDEVKARWPETGERAVEASYAFAQAQGTGETYDDRPRDNQWADYKRKRVRVIQIHWREGVEWWTATFAAGGFLTEPEKSPYLDQYGMAECSLILQSAYVDRENVRYGAVKDMIGPQDEINKRRSKALHLMSVRQVIAEEGAVHDVDAARAELAKPDGYVEVAPQFRFDIANTGDLAAAQFQLLQEAKSELEAVGPNATMQGRQGASASGRAIALSQQGGAIEVDGALLDRHRQWKRRIYRAIWNRVRQFWTEEKWLRVTDDNQHVQFVGLNRPKTVGDALAELPPQQQQMMAQQAGLQPGDPRLAQPLMGPDGKPVLANNVGSLDVDIIVDEAPDVATLQIEEFQQLAQLMQGMPALGPLALDLLIRASSLRSKDELLERVEAALQPQQGPQQQGPSPEMMKVQAQAQADQARLQLDAQRQQAELALAARKQHGEMMLKAWTARANVDIKRQQEAMAQLAGLMPPQPMMQ